MRSELSNRAAAILEAAWNEQGYASPNIETYPWLWLWDSCFHSVIWAHLGDKRAVEEIEAALDSQSPSGFVPHMSYVKDPGKSLGLWGVSGSSSITQPPMFGHALRVARSVGFEVPEETESRIARALAHLAETRSSRSGLLHLTHPWETGCDDSIRWSSWMPNPFDQGAWKETKAAFVGDLVLDDDGMATGSASFHPTSVALTALAAFNINELNGTKSGEWLAPTARALTASLERSWNAENCIWSDGSHPDGAAMTLEALLPLLVIDDEEQAEAAFNHLLDVEVFHAPFGPRQTSISDDRYDPDAYWRGPVWPQLSYLIWLGAKRWGRTDVAAWIARSTIAGAKESGFAEYWNPETGRGGGAVPQSWTGLALVMDE